MRFKYPSVWCKLGIHIRRGYTGKWWYTRAWCQTCTHNQLISQHRDPLSYRFSITVPNLAQKFWSTPKLWPNSKSKSKMAAVRHLGFVTSSFRTTHEVFSLDHIGLWNFMLIRCIVLKIWRFEFFCRFGLKCPFMPPNFLGVWTPKRDWSSSRPPKGTSLAETALTCQFWCRSVAWCDLGACWSNQKRRKKGKKRNFFWRRFPIDFDQWLI